MFPNILVDHFNIAVYFALLRIQYRIKTSISTDVCINMYIKKKTIIIMKKKIYVTSNFNSVLLKWLLVGNKLF